MKDFIEIFWPILILIVIVFGLMSILVWFSSCKSSEVFNRQNGTNYTCSDFFWAGQQINSQTQTIKLQK